MGSAEGKQGQTGGGSDPAAGLRSARKGALGLGPGAEFDLIRTFLREPDAAGREDVPVGPGDDCAVVAGEGIALTSDLSIEGVHFRRDWLAPEEIGYRAATASLSDLAAMAARPIGVLVSLAIPPDETELATRIMAGVREALEPVGGALLGGDLSRSPQVVIDVVGVGEAARPVLRSGARPGDEVWVTGVLGGAAHVVAELLAGRAAPVEAWPAFARPRARNAEAIWLADRRLPTSMLDLSDGLGGDAGHLASSSGVAIVLDPEALPLHPTLAALERTAALSLAIGGGEDYELCFTARAGAVQPVAAAFAEAFGIALTRVGRVEEGAGVFTTNATGERTRLENGGYQHFRGEA